MFQENDVNKPQARLTSAARIFYIIGITKFLGLLTGMRFATMAPSEAAAAASPLPVPHGLMVILIFVWYGGALAIAVAIGRGLENRRRWARPAGMVFGGLHLASVLMYPYMGGMAILNGVLGLFAVVSLHIAGELGAFEQSA